MGKPASCAVLRCGSFLEPTGSGLCGALPEPPLALCHPLGVLVSKTSCIRVQAWPRSTLFLRDKSLLRTRPFLVSALLPTPGP